MFGGHAALCRAKGVKYAEFGLFQLDIFFFGGTSASLFVIKFVSFACLLACLFGKEVSKLVSQSFCLAY